jgi:hypothetical protein
MKEKKPETIFCYKSKISSSALNVDFLKYQRIYMGCDPTMSTYLEAQTRTVNDRGK